MALTEATAGIIAAGIGAAGNVASQAAGNVRSQKKWEKRQKFLEQQQMRAEQRQFDYNKQLQDYAYSQNLAQWNRENAYNSPSAQMARFSAAGLNPNLVYGDSGAALAANSPQMQIGDVGTGSSNVAPYAQEGYGGSFDYLGALQYAMQSRMTDAQIANINADTLGKLSDADFKSASFDLRLEDLAAGVANTVGDTQLKGAQMENLGADTEGKKIANEIADAIKGTAIEQAAAALENTKRQGWNLEKMGKQIDAITAKTNLESELLKVQKRIAQLDEQIKKVDASNADELMELRKKREQAAIELVNKQTRVLAKDLQYYDRKALAALALSAAEQYNRMSYGKLANENTSAQAIQNRINEILLDPTHEVSVRDYMSMLLLKNMNETQLLDVLKYATDTGFKVADVIGGDDDDDKSSDSPSSSEVNSLIEDYSSKLNSSQRNKYENWLHNTNGATDEQKLDFLKKLFE